MKQDPNMIEKIKKCLALAKSSNEHEAANALRQAQNLMQKYNINTADIDAAQANEKDTRSNVKKKPSKWESLLARTVAKAFSCKNIFSSNIFGQAVWKFIGTGTAPELAAYAFEVLLRQLKKDRANYIKSKLYRCKRANKTSRADNYCYSWVLEVYSTISDFAPNQAQKKAINAYVKKKYPALTDLTSHSRTTKGSKDNQCKDNLAGYLDGANAQLNRGVNENQTNRLETV